MRYTVLTYIFNGYERVHEISEKDPDANYVLVTDDPQLTSRTWNVVYDPSLDRRSPFGKCYEVRFHPFRYADTNTVLRVDGSIEIRKPLRAFIEAVAMGGYDRCMMIHPERNSLIEEYDTWCHQRGYSIKQAAKCMRLMEQMGYDFCYKGLFQGCFEVVVDNPINRDVNDITFGLLCALGDGKIERINQTVLSFVLNRFYADEISILPVGESIITDGNLMQWYSHNSDTPIPMNRRSIDPWMFNERVDVWRVNP